MARVLFDQTGMGTDGWLNMQYLVTATGTSTTLKFGFRNDPYYFALDDVSVTAVRAPVFQSLVKSGGSVNLSWNAMAGPTYQLQYTTNLTQSSWINLGNAINGTNGTVTATDVSPSDPQRFYRLQMLP